MIKEEKNGTVKLRDSDSDGVLFFFLSLNVQRVPVEFGQHPSKQATISPERERLKV